MYDSSGIRVYYTEHLRKYDMGVLHLGFLTVPVHFIPPGSESFVSYGLCKTEKFEEVKASHSLSDVPCSPPRPDPGVHRARAQTWRVTTAWCSGRLPPWVMQERRMPGIWG